MKSLNVGNFSGNVGCSISQYMVLVLILTGIKCVRPEGDQSQVLIMNKCCPDESDYRAESDECVKTTLEVRLQNETSNNITLIKETYSNNRINLENNLTLPKTLILPLSDSLNSTQELGDFKIRLEQFLPNKTSTCAKGSFMVHIQIGGKRESKDVEEDSGDSAIFTDDGRLKYLNEYFIKSEFCISRFNGEAISVRVCKPTCTGEAPCIRKCCDLNQVWNQVRGMGRQMCSPTEKHMWTPFYYKNPRLKATEQEKNAVHVHYQISHPREWCNKSNIPAIFRPTGTANKFRVLLNAGVIRSVNRYDWKDTEEDREYYCLDGVINSNILPPDTPNETEYSGNDETDSILFDCSPPPPQEKSKSQSMLYGVVLIISSIFLLFTIAVYILLWEKQNVHGWTLMCYAISLFFMYIFFAMMHFSQFTLIQGRNGKLGIFCFFIGVGLNFFFVSTFCWMSMINFDLWCTFKALKPTGGRSKGFKRFLGYAAFSVGVPTTIVSTAMALDSTYGEDYDTDIIVPEYGRKRCNLDPKYAQLVFAYGPAGFLLACNLIFFTVTMYTMWQIHQSTKFATNSSSKSQKQKQSVQLFAKLLFVMGIPWIFEVISWAVEREKSSTSWYWVIFDMINILQALAIFLIFVCKRDIIHSLEQKYPRFKAFLNRVMLDADKVDKISKQYPRLKGILKPFTRRTQDVNSSRNTQTESSYATNNSDIHDNENINMQTNK